jgi:hypothetical protein
VEVRPHRLGYAVFEIPTRLLDFGVTRFDSSHASLDRLTALMSRYGPAVVVLRKLGVRSTSKPPSHEGSTAADLSSGASFLNPYSRSQGSANENQSGR